MKSGDQNLIDLIKRFEVVNKEVIQMSRRLSEMKLEILAIKNKIKIAGDL